jgi:hypothetical protein
MAKQRIDSTQDAGLRRVAAGLARAADDLDRTLAGIHRLARLLKEHPDCRDKKGMGLPQSLADWLLSGLLATLNDAGLEEAPRFLRSDADLVSARQDWLNSLAEAALDEADARDRRRVSARVNRLRKVKAQRPALKLVKAAHAA